MNRNIKFTEAVIPYSNNINDYAKLLTEEDKKELDRLCRFDKRTPEEIKNAGGFFPLNNEDGKKPLEFYLHRIQTFVLPVTTNGVSTTSDPTVMSRNFSNLNNRYAYRVPNLRSYCYVIDLSKIKTPIYEIKAPAGTVDLKEFLCTQIPLEAIMGYYMCNEKNELKGSFTPFQKQTFQDTKQIQR